jgi:hypothetical protein
VSALAPPAAVAPSTALPATTRRGADRRVTAALPLLARALQPAARDAPLGVPAAARAAFLAARRSLLAEDRPLVAVVRTEEEAHRLADDLAAWLASGEVRVLPERAALPLERALPEHDESAERLEVLALLADAPPALVVVAPLLAVVQRTLGVPQLAASRLPLAVGERVDQRRLLSTLVAGGYDPVVEVTGVGEFTSRGGIVDAWPPGAAEPLRIELFGDEVESIRAFRPRHAGEPRSPPADRPAAGERVPARSGLRRSRRARATPPDRGAGGGPRAPAGRRSRGGRRGVGRRADRRAGRRSPARRACRPRRPERAAGDRHRARSAGGRATRGARRVRGAAGRLAAPVRGGG